MDGAGTPAGLWHALGRLWPSYLAYLIAFLTILVAWIGHHTLLNSVRRVSGPLLTNGGFLLTVSFLPFPTALVAEHLGHTSATVATAVYALVNLLSSLAFYALGRAVYVQADGAPALLGPVRRAGFGTGWCLLCAGVAFVSPLLSLLLVGGLWAWWLIPVLRRRGSG